MENLDIIILSSILSSLFLVFVVVVYRELSKVEPVYTPSIEKGPRADFIRFVGSIFDQNSKKVSLKERVLVYKQVKRTISDMETNGVYFPKEVKEQLEKERESITCEYSGLRSVISYLEEDDFFTGHS